MYIENTLTLTLVHLTETNCFVDFCGKNAKVKFVVD